MPVSLMRRRSSSARCGLGLPLGFAVTLVRPPVICRNAPRLALRQISANLAKFRQISGKWRISRPVYPDEHHPSFHLSAPLFPISFSDRGICADSDPGLQTERLNLFSSR